MLKSFTIIYSNVNLWIKSLANEMRTKQKVNMACAETKSSIKNLFFLQHLVVFAFRSKQSNLINEFSNNFKAKPCTQMHLLVSKYVNQWRFASLCRVSFAKVKLKLCCVMDNKYLAHINVFFLLQHARIRYTHAKIFSKFHGFGLFVPENWKKRSGIFNWISGMHADF